MFYYTDSSRVIETFGQILMKLSPEVQLGLFLGLFCDLLF